MAEEFGEVCRFVEAKLGGDGFVKQVMMSQDRHCGWRGKMQRQLSSAEQADIDRLRGVGKWPRRTATCSLIFSPCCMRAG